MKWQHLAALALGLLAGCFAALPAHAGDGITVGLHGPSTHFRASGSCGDGDARTGPNNANPGAFVRWNGWEAGDYYNSRCKNTAYAGYMWEPAWSFLGMKPGVLIAAATGYSKPGKFPVLPGGSVSVSFRVPFAPASVRGRLEYTHNPRADTKGVLHTRLEYAF